MDYYNNKTRKKISEDEYKTLSPEEKKACREWTEKPPARNRRTKQDPEWYVLDKSITDAVANIPFNVFAGVSQSIDWITSGGSISGKASAVVPGVFTFNVTPVYGASKEGMSAINIASKALYSFVRHMNSGRTNYESPDLMMYVMAMSQIYAAINDAERAYELAMTYTYENKYIPTRIARALGLDLADISANLANFRAQINLIIAKASSLVIPKGFNIHKRHALIMRAVFTDSDSLRGQFYCFKPYSFLQWDPTGQTTGTSLKEVKVPATGNSSLRLAKDIINNLNNLLNAIIYDEDANIMSGDILKAFGSSELYELEMLSENSTVLFTFNENVLQQIENARWTATVSTDSYSIQQSDTDIYTFEPGALSTGGAVGMNDCFFNSHKDNPTPEDVIEWSRLVTGISSGLITYGTEFIRSATLLKVRRNTAGQDVYTTIEMTSNVVSYSATSTTQLLAYAQLALELEAYDWHPFLYAISVSGPEGSVQAYDSFGGDIKLAAILTLDQAAKLNDAAIMGALNSLKYITQAKTNQK